MFTKRGLAFILGTLLTLSAQASETCFIAKEKGQIIKMTGSCNLRHSPYSTFKIPLALMGYDSGFLKTPEAPVLHFTKQNKKDITSIYDPKKYPVMLMWEKDHSPLSWMKYSVVWYSQEITKDLGMKKFQYYVDKLNYGNRDLSGLAGEGDGLTLSWINSSLQINPTEMTDFLEKLSNKSFPFSKMAQENTAKLIALDNLNNQWKLYGKTGGGTESGWFVGWVEKGDRRIVFTQYLDCRGGKKFGGSAAKAQAKANLLALDLS